MRRLFNIFATTLLAVSFLACEREKVYNGGDNSTGVEIDLDNCIQFNTGISSRGSLIMSDYLQANFNVYGYVYRSNWEAAKAMATPNVFDATPQTVVYNEGTYTYTPIVQWTGYKYSFFAYYPAEGKSKNITITPSGKDIEGEPYITYHFDRSDPRTTADVMTAQYIDTDANSTKEVQLHFHHRLSAIDIAAVNYCEYDPDPENNDATDSLPVTIQIFEAKFTITNLLYNTAQISLNKDIEKSIIPSNSETSTKAEFSIVADDDSYDTDKLIEPNTDGDIQMRYITSSEENTSMIVIPQETPLHVEPVIRFYKRLPDANGKARFLDTNEEVKEFDLDAQGGYTGEPPIFKYATAFDFDRGLLEGRRYFIQINFTSDAVSVNIIAADEWDDKQQVNHEFM